MRVQLPILTLTLSLSLAGAAHAERWRWFPINGGAVAFDEDSRIKDPLTGVGTLETVVFYAQPRTVPAGDYSFMAEKLQFECNDQRYRWERSVVYAANGDFVTARADGPWTPTGTEAGSVNLYRRILCGSETPPPTQEAKDIEALMTAIRTAAGPATPVAAARPPAATPAPTPAPAIAPPAAALRTTATAAPAPAAPAAPVVAKPLDFDALAASLANGAAPAK